MARIKYLRTTFNFKMEPRSVKKQLSDKDKQDLAFALILLKDFKADGANNV
jgi:hypothetical protein